MSKTLEALLADIRSCKACCEDLPLEPRPILSASSSAKLLVVGQAPGIRVHETGIAWNDASGERLRQWMGIDKALFYDVTQVAILPMGFCYPGRGKSGDLPPRPLCSKLWREELHQYLPEVRLTLLIGQYAQRFYLMDKVTNVAGAHFVSVTQTVADWQRYLPAFLPLPHPSPRNNIWLRKNAWFESDVLPELRRQVAITLGLPMVDSD